MKKAIIVHGNIASGKSTFCKHLLKAIGDYYKWVSIDNYRKEAYESLRSAPPYIKEKYAQKRYMEDLEQSNRVLIETTAVSRLWDKTMGKLRSDQADILFVRIVCPPDLCIERYKVRMHERARAGEINYQHPSTMKKSIEDSVFFTMWNRHNVKDTIELDSSSMTVNDMGLKFIKELKADGFEL